MRVKAIKIYEFNELSQEAKDKVLEHVRNNWHDLGDHVIEDVISSLKALADYVGGELDYSVSLVPDQGEFIKLTNYDKEKLSELVRDKEEARLTGTCYDYDVIEALDCGNIESILNTIHIEGEYIYSDEGLTEMLINNEYEFTEDGKFYN